MFVLKKNSLWSFSKFVADRKKTSNSGGKIKINRFSALKGGISNLFEFFAETKRNPALKNWKEVLGAKKLFSSKKKFGTEKVFGTFPGLFPDFSGIFSGHLSSHKSASRLSHFLSPPRSYHLWRPSLSVVLLAQVETRVLEVGSSCTTWT